MIRTWLPTRRTEPSTTASTFNSRAIWGSGLRVPLYCMTEVREITRSALILDRLVISASVIPSAKYSCSGSPDRFSNGRTASELMITAWGRLKSRSRHPPTFNAMSNATTATTPTAT